MALQGTSVVLYRSKDIRRYQYTRITDWSGGLYISPGAHPVPCKEGSEPSIIALISLACCCDMICIFKELPKTKARPPSNQLSFLGSSMLFTVAVSHFGQGARG